MKKSIAAVLSLISVAAFLFVIAGCGKENKHPDAKRIAAEEFGMEKIRVTCSGGAGHRHISRYKALRDLCVGAQRWGRDDDRCSRPEKTKGL